MLRRIVTSLTQWPCGPCSKKETTKHRNKRGADDSARGALVTCPITLSTPTQPVFCTVDGYIYERSAIETILAQTGVSPMTRERFTAADLRDVYGLNSTAAQQATAVVPSAKEVTNSTTTSAVQAEVNTALVPFPFEVTPEERLALPNVILRMTPRPSPEVRYLSRHDVFIDLVRDPTGRHPLLFAYPQFLPDSTAEDEDEDPHDDHRQLAHDEDAALNAVGSVAAAADPLRHRRLSPTLLPPLRRPPARFPVSLCIMIDMSASMQEMEDTRWSFIECGNSRARRANVPRWLRLELAIHAAESIIRQLGSRDYLQILTYNDQHFRLLFPYQAMVSTREGLAQERARDALQTITFDSVHGTAHTHVALRSAVQALPRFARVLLFTAGEDSEMAGFVNDFELWWGPDALHQRCILDVFLLTVTHSRAWYTSLQQTAERTGGWFVVAPDMTSMREKMKTFLATLFASAAERVTQMMGERSGFVAGALLIGQPKLLPIGIENSTCIDLRSGPWFNRLTSWLAQVSPHDNRSFKIDPCLNQGDELYRALVQSDMLAFRRAVVCRAPEHMATLSSHRQRYEEEGPSRDGLAAPDCMLAAWKPAVPRILRAMSMAASAPASAPVPAPAPVASVLPPHFASPFTPMSEASAYNGGDTDCAAEAALYISCLSHALRLQYQPNPEETGLSMFVARSDLRTAWVAYLREDFLRHPPSQVAMTPV